MLLLGSWGYAIRQIRRVICPQLCLLPNEQVVLVQTCWPVAAFATSYCAWLSVSIDFITGLPVSSLGNVCVLVCVDRFTKGVHLAACKKTITAKEFALLLFQTVYRLHGIPQDIVSDRGTLFTSQFWK